MLKPVRLRHLQGHPAAAHGPAMEDLHDVRHDQYRRHGHLLRVRCFSSALRPRFPDIGHRLIPETKGRSLEEMDLIFGSISAEERSTNIRRMQAEQGVEHGSDPGSEAGKEGSVTKREIV